MMTRKDYVEVANILKKYSEAGMIREQTAQFLTSDFADLMESDNPRFDRQRFWNAVFTEENVNA